MSYVLSSTNGNKLLHIRTQDLDQSQFNNPNLKTDIQVNLEVPIEVFDNEHLGLSLHSISIPFSFFNIDNYSNHFQARLVGSPTWIDLYVTIGNYNIKQLASVIKGLLDSNLSSTFTIVYSSIKSGITIVDTLSGSEYELNFNTSNSIYRQLGFSKTSYTSVSHTLTSVNAISLFPYQSIYIHCDLILGDSQDSKGHQADILERVPCLSANSLVYFRPTSTQQKFLINRKSISTFRIYLTYDRLTPVDTRNIDFEISLQFLTIQGLDRTNPITESPQDIAFKEVPSS